MEAIAKGVPVKAKRGTLNVGVDVLPAIPRHSGDRNRTSPMAFTGNRFEFRAVGSSMSIAGPLVVLNSIMAESLDYCAGILEKADTSTPVKLGKAVEKIIKDVWKECSAIVFNGDGYSEAWHKEAAKRGLPNLKTCADALPVIKSTEVIDLFTKYKVLSKRETISRYEVYAEQYLRSVNVEVKLFIEMVKTIIFPAAVRYQSELAVSLANLRAIDIETDHDTINKITGLIKCLQESVAELEELRLKQAESEEIEDKCRCCVDELLPNMKRIRGYADELEGLVADDIWPLPTYQEMLFIK
jgi:glutamine synthetase